MAKELVLVVEDEEDIRELINYNLSREGYSVIEAESGEEGLLMARSRRPDITLLDLMLPGIDGLEYCRRVKRDEAAQDIPIIMVTAKDEETDIVTGLELGADDYITKPFSPKVVIARIKAVLRRGSEAIKAEDEILSFRDMVIHPGRYEVRISDRLVNLTYSEFAILHFLARRPGWVFTRYQIVDAIHGEKHPVSDRSVDVQIVGLRRKLGSCGDLIETVRGVGYRFRE